MKKSKFDLLFENIMETLSDAEVSYTPVHDIVLDCIADWLDMPIGEIYENGWDINVYIASEEDIISFVNSGFSNDVTRAEAKRLAGKLLIIDLEGLPIDQDTYNEMEEDKDLYNDILHAVNENGLTEIIELYMR